MVDCSVSGLAVGNGTEKRKKKERRGNFLFLSTFISISFREYKGEIHWRKLQVMKLICNEESFTTIISPTVSGDGVKVEICLVSS